jgi:hypothetical protein
MFMHVKSHLDGAGDIAMAWSPDQGGHWVGAKYKH